jgi:hypothetical protein
MCAFSRVIPRRGREPGFVAGSVSFVAPIAGLGAVVAVSFDLLVVEKDLLVGNHKR